VQGRLDLGDDGLSMLQYVDDTITFIDHDIDKAKNMKLLLWVFEQLSGPKINFHKGEIFCSVWAKQFELKYSILFGCTMGTYLFRYLGIPFLCRKLSNKD
jgi:hypothetical protein